VDRGTDRRSFTERKLVAVAETADAHLRAETDQDADAARAAGDALNPSASSCNGCRPLAD
jgi:hypothetical protein